MLIKAYNHTQVKRAYILLFIFQSCIGMSTYILIMLLTLGLVFP